MSDVNANIRIGVDSTQAISSLRSLQSQISAFNKSVIASNSQAMAAQASALAGLTAQIGATKQFSTSIVNVESSVSRLGNAIDKNKLSMGEYFRYGTASTKTFGRMFGKEHTQIMELASDRVKRLQTQYIALSSAQNGMTKAMAVRPLHLFNADAAISVQRQQLFNKLLNDGSTKVINFGKNTQWAGRQLMVGFTVPLTIFGGLAGKIFMDLEKQIVNFRRVYGDAMTPAGETDKMIEEVKALGKEFTKYGIAVKDTVGLASDIAAAGAQGEDLVAATAESTRLATLGMIEMNQAMTATMALQTAFRLSNEELAQSVDFLNAVENQTVLSLDDVTVAIPKVAPIIKGLGGDVQDLAIFLTAMREGGVNAAEGANALKSGLASLINPTKNAKEQLEKVGININSILSQNKGDIRAIVTEFGSALGELGKFERQQTLAKVFGKYQFARLGALFENISRDGSQAQRVVDLTGQSFEELAALSEKELGAIEDSIGVKFTGAIERLKLALAPIGEVFLKIATPIVDLATKILDKFNELSPGVKQFISVVVAGVGVVAPAVIMLVGLFGNFIGQAIKGFAMFNNFFNRLRGGGKDLSYLSNEQLDAAAAATTLEGRTKSLTTALNVQRSAVSQLARAYAGYATAAGAAASGLPQGFRGPARKMATGGMVGGRGNKDTEPALLTPGEFVMNKEATEKFGPVLDAMNRGSVGQYSEGSKSKKQSGAESRQFKSGAFVLRGLGANIGAGGSGTGILSEILSISAKNISDVTSLYVSEIAKSANTSVSAINKEIKEWQTKNSQYLEQFNRKLATAIESGDLPAQQKLVNEASEKFTKDMKAANGPVAKFSAQAQKDFPKLSADLSRTQQIIKSTSLNLSDANQSSKFFEENMEKTALLSKISKPGTYQPQARAAAGAISTFGDVDIQKYGVPGQFIDPMARRTAGRASSYGLSGEQSLSLYKSGTSAEHVSKTPQQLKKEADLAAKIFIDEYSEDISRQDPTGKGLKMEAGRRSPHRQAKQNAKEDATAYVNTYSKTVESGMKKRRGASRPQGPAGASSSVLVAQIAEEERLQRQSQRGSRGKVTREGDFDRRERLRAIRPGEESTRVSNVANAQQMAMREQIDRDYNQAVIENTVRTKAVSTELVKQPSKIKRFGSSLVAGSGKMMGAMFALDGIIFGLSMMDNSIGQFAQKIMPAAFALSGLTSVIPMLSKALPLLLNPVGLLVAGITLAVGSFFLIHKFADNMAKRGKELSDAMYGTKKSIENAGDFFDKQSSTEKLGVLKTEAVTGQKQTSENLQQASEFISSELGNKLVKDITSVRDQLGSKEASSALSNQLGRMLLAGVIDSNMAYSIATEVGKEIGDTNLSTRVSANLREIVGPDGQNLLNEESRVQIFADIVADATNVQKSIEDAGLIWDGMGWLGQVTMMVGGKGTSDIAAENVAQNLINAQSIVNEELARNKLAYEEGTISAKKFYEQNIKIISQAKESGASWKTAIDDFKKAYQGENIVGELDTITQSLIDPLLTSLESAMGKGQFGKLISKGMVSGAEVALNRDTNIVEDAGGGIDMLNAQDVRNQLERYQSDIDHLNEQIADAQKQNDTEREKSLKDQLLVVEDYKKTLDAASTGFMEIVVGIESGVISQDTLINILEGGKSIQELSAQLSILPDDQSIRILSFLEESGGEGLKSEIILDVMSNMTPEQLDKIGTTMINLLDLPDPVAEKTLMSFKGMTPAQIEKEIDKIKKGANELKNLDTEKEVALYMKDEFSTIVNRFKLDYEYIAGLPAQQKYVYFDYITRYQTHILPELQGDAAGRAYLRGGGGPVGAEGTVITPPTEDDPIDTPDPEDTGGGSATKSWLEGLVAETEANLKLFPGMINKIKNKFPGIPEQIVEMIGGGEEGFKRAQELLNANKKKVKELLAKYRKATVAETLRGVQDKVKTEKRSNRAESILKNQGFSEEEAKELASNTDYVFALLEAKAGRGGKSVKEVTAAFRELIEITKESSDPVKDKLEEINTIYKGQMLPLQQKIDKQQEIVDGIQEEIDALQKLNDSDQNRIRSLERQKEMIERQIEEYERANELDQRRIDTLQRQDELRNRESDALSHELDVLSDMETKIKDAYQERIDALTKVSKLNDDILQKEKDQLSLSQALAEGDIYAATAAAQQMKQNQIKSAQDLSMEALNESRDNSIAGLTTSGGLTRDQAEERIKQIKEQSYQTSLLIRDIEDAIFNRNQLMIPLKDQQLVLDRQIRDISDTIYNRETSILKIQTDKLDPATKILKNYNDEAIALRNQLEAQSSILEGVNLINSMTDDQIKAAGLLGSTWHEVAKQIQQAQKAAKGDMKALEPPDPKAEKYKGNAGKYDAALSEYNKKVAEIKAKEAAAIAAAMNSGQAAMNKNMGGKIKKYANGSVVGEGSRDSVSAMLTPGEYVIRKAMVDKYGTPMFEKINQGSFSMPSFSTGEQGPTSVSGKSGGNTNVVAPMYNNYSVNVSVSNSGASADEIANKTLMKIKQLQSTQIRSGRGF